LGNQEVPAPKTKNKAENESAISQSLRGKETKEMRAFIQYTMRE